MGDPLEDRWLKSYEFRSDLIKQLITLATGVIGVSATFAPNAHGFLKFLLFASWILLVLSIGLGITSLGGMGTNLAEANDPAARPDLTETNALKPFQFQWLLFLLGTFVATGTYAFMPGKDEEDSKSTPVINAPRHIQYYAPQGKDDEGKGEQPQPKVQGSDEKLHPGEPPIGATEEG